VPARGIARVRCVRVLASRVRALARTYVERFGYTARGEVLARCLVHWGGWPWLSLGGGLGSLVRLVRLLPSLVRSLPGGFGSVVLVWVRGLTSFRRGVPGRLASFAHGLPCLFCGAGLPLSLACFAGLPSSTGGAPVPHAFERSIWLRRSRFSHASATILLGISTGWLYNELVLTELR
jgi:hypothetical protein